MALSLGVGTCGLGMILIVGQPALPLADEVDEAALREQCRRLHEALANLGDPFPGETGRQLQALLQCPADPQATIKFQRLLDSHCLVGVHINPESRVKALRGPRPAELVHNRPVFVLLKVVNEAGITAPLNIGGPQLLGRPKARADAWLEADVVTAKPLAPTLTGQRLDYVVVRLIARQRGKREATLQFDAGQGTQDLGFRAEVPVLFQVREGPEAFGDAQGRRRLWTTADASYNVPARIRDKLKGCR
ncbi:MAG: hypothetical protein NZ700_02920 [Gemmataceae bacterium]|nr:hypothetical protein [Gemmataceae bacterium]MDW8266699.1 hypothetical protein [Gemmataceae bacterium]